MGTQTLQLTFAEQRLLDEFQRGFPLEPRPFVGTAPDRTRLDAVLADIEARSGLDALDLPMLEDYFIDLGFRLQWT